MILRNSSPEHKDKVFIVVFNLEFFSYLGSWWGIFAIDTI
jgi:hypothetical protein